MEGTIRLIFFLVMGIIWILSAIAKKRKMESGPPGGGDVSTGGIYKAPEDDLQRFLKMVTGGVAKTPPVRPIIEEKEEVKPEVFVEEETPEPEIEEVLPLEPISIEQERMEEEKYFEQPRIEKKLDIPSNLTDLQRAIVLYEIIGRPRSMKPYRRLRH